MRLITADTPPDHDTICTFRRANRDLVSESFVKLLPLAQALKLTQFGQVTGSLDGPKVAANASKHAAESFELVLARAGASLRRDAVDRRVVENVRNRQGRVLDSQQEVGGWPVLHSAALPPDRDRDGMPDAWEKAHGLNPDNPADRNADRDGDGYTNLEEYLNSLVPHR